MTVQLTFSLRLIVVHSHVVMTCHFLLVDPSSHVLFFFCLCLFDLYIFGEVSELNFGHIHIWSFMLYISFLCAFRAGIKSEIGIIAQLTLSLEFHHTNQLSSSPSLSHWLKPKALILEMATSNW